MPVELHLLILILSLIESFPSAEVGIQSASLVAAIAVAAIVAGTELVVPSPLLQVGSSAGLAVAKGASFEREIGAGLLSRTRHNVDGPHK